MRFLSGRTHVRLPHITKLLLLEHLCTHSLIPLLIFLLIHLLDALTVMVYIVSMEVYQSRRRESGWKIVQWDWGAYADAFRMHSLMHFGCIRRCIIKSSTKDAFYDVF